MRDHHHDIYVFSIALRGATSIWKLIRACHARLGQRHELNQLDDERLRDIGLTPADVRRELAKWPWQR